MIFNLKQIIMGFEVIPKKTVSVILPLELYEWLAVLAQDTARTVPGYIRQVLKSYLWHLENRPESLKDWPVTKGFMGQGK